MIDPTRAGRAPSGPIGASLESRGSSSSNLAAQVHTFSALQALRASCFQHFAFWRNIHGMMGSAVSVFVLGHQQKKRQAISGVCTLLLAKEKALK